VVTLAGVLRRFGAAYLAARTLSTPQAKAWRAIVACRTALLGGHRVHCDTCEHSHPVYHSCRNRHCPQCGARAQDRWLQARLAEVLAVPYAHLVFTLPHALNALHSAYPQWLIQTLFASTAQTLTEFAQNARWLGGTPAFTLVLHTWTQDLRRHLHLHALVACGALTAGGHWQLPRRAPRFLFPVSALSTVFRGKFMAALQQAHQQNLLPRDPQSADALWRQRTRQLYRYQWVVYAKTPLGGPAQVLEYLARYTHRTALSNERIVDMNDAEVRLRVRADAHGGKRVVSLPGPEFVRRFLLHVLPTGCKRIRHYGLLAPAGKRVQLARARQALQMPVANPRARESAQDFLQRVAQHDLQQCPCCPTGRLRVIATLPASRRLPALAATMDPPPRPTSPLRPACRGPPSAPVQPR